MPSSPNSLLNLIPKGTRECFACGEEYKPKVNNQKFCSPTCMVSKQVERSYKYLNNNPEAYIRLLLNKKGRKHIPVEYLLELLEQQQNKCAVSGIEMTFTKKTDGIKVHTNLSIDRIDSSKGYEIGNIQLVCAIVNIMKSTLTMDELNWWCYEIVRNISNA